MEMRVKWEEMCGHLWCMMCNYSWEYALITSICPRHVQHPVRYYYIIPFHGIPGIEIVYMCIRDVQQREICERLLLYYNKEHLMKLPRTPPIPFSYVSCVYMFLFVFSRQYWGGGVGVYIIRCFQHATRFHIFIRRYFIFTMIVRSDQQGYSRIYR